MENQLDICKVSEWSEWGDCTKPCGGGVQYSNRYPLHDGYNEYDCGSLTRSQSCNEHLCNIPVVVIFKHIDYKNHKFIGWSEEEVKTACEKNIDITKIADTITLYHDPEYKLVVGIYLEPDETSQFFTDFNVTATGQYAYANGVFIKIKNRQVSKIIECDFVGTVSDDGEKEEWCGGEFTPESYICVNGTGELGGILNKKIDDKYYYHQKSPSLKSEWMSKNNLLSIKYLTANDSKNETLKHNIWAIVDSSHSILYYTTEFDELEICPPIDSTWIPMFPMNSNNLSLSKNCDYTNEANMSCDLKDVFNANWINVHDIDEFLNVFEKNSVIQNEKTKYKNDFVDVMKRGAGLPENEENVYKQSFRGYFNFNKLVTNPSGVGVLDYLDKDETSADILHKIEFPLSKPVDLVNVKIVSVMESVDHFILQMYSLKEQKWIHLENINHFTTNQQIVTNVKNDNYEATNPPLDGSDIIGDSIVALRILYGNYDYEMQMETSRNVTRNQKLLIHSIRVEARDTVKCLSSEVDFLNNKDIFQVTKISNYEKPKLYQGFTEIVGDLCVGNKLYGNYKYEGKIEDIYYRWSVNDILISNSRHLNTDSLNVGDFLKFDVTFVYGGGVETKFSATAVLEDCKTKIYPPLESSADFRLVNRTHENNNITLVGYDWPDVACGQSETNLVKFYWRGNLEVGKQISTESEFQTNELIQPGRQYFLCREENCVIKVSKQLVIAEIVSCPPENFILSISKNYALESNSSVGTFVGRLIATPVNKNVKYRLNKNSFGIHNDLFELSGGDPVNNLNNINLIVKEDISKLGTDAKVSITATSSTDVGLVNQNFTINIKKQELQRYAECPRIHISGFLCDFMNGNYGLVYHDTLSTTKSIGYEYYNGKLVYRTVRKYTSGFLLSDGTVEFGSGYVYSEIRWNDLKLRWELYVYSDDNSSDNNFNEKYKNGKICAFSEGYATECPQNQTFKGVSSSFGSASVDETSLVNLGDDFDSDCSQQNIC